MKLAARDGQGVLVVPAVVEHEVKEEFSLSLVGTTAAVREELYLISLERRLKNPLLLSVWQEGTRDLFGSRGQNRKRPRKSHSQNSQ